MSGIAQWAKNVEAYAFEDPITMPGPVTPGNTLVIMMGGPYGGSAPATWFDNTVGGGGSNTYNLIPGSDVGNAFTTFVCLDCPYGGDRELAVPVYGTQTWWIEVEGVFDIDVANLANWGVANSLSITTTVADVILAIGWGLSPNSNPPGPPSDLGAGPESTLIDVMDQYGSQGLRTLTEFQIANVAGTVTSSVTAGPDTYVDYLAGAIAFKIGTPVPPTPGPPGGLAAYPSTDPSDYGVRGLEWMVERSPEFVTAVQTMASGKEFRLGFWQYPTWHWKLSYSVLSDNPGDLFNGNAYTDLKTLEGFFLSRQGTYETFAFWDPSDNTVVGQEIGVGDGFTTAFQMVRNFGGFIEAIQAPQTTPAPTVYLDNVATYTFTLSDLGGVLTFDPAPDDGVVITADFSYYFPARFETDDLEFSEFMWNLWEQREVRLQSVKL